MDSYKFQVATCRRWDGPPTDMFMGGILWILCCSSNSLAHFIHIHKLPALVGARIPVGEWDILPETPSEPPHNFDRKKPRHPWDFLWSQSIGCTPFHGQGPSRHLMTCLCAMARAGWAPGEAMGRCDMPRSSAPKLSNLGDMWVYVCDSVDTFRSRIP